MHPTIHNAPNAIAQRCKVSSFCQLHAKGLIVLALKIHQGWLRHAVVNTAATGCSRGDGRQAGSHRQGHGARSRQLNPPSWAYYRRQRTGRCTPPLLYQGCRSHFCTLSCHSAHMAEPTAQAIELFVRGDKPGAHHCTLIETGWSQAGSCRALSPCKCDCLLASTAKKDHLRLFPCLVDIVPPSALEGVTQKHRSQQCSPHLH